MTSEKKIRLLDRLFSRSSETKKIPARGEDFQYLYSGSPEVLDLFDLIHQHILLRALGYVVFHQR